MGLGRPAGRDDLAPRAEAWRPHRSAASFFVVRGITVNDIIGPGSARPHRLTAFAVVDGERLTYPPGFSSR